MPFLILQTFNEDGSDISNLADELLGRFKALVDKLAGVLDADHHSEKSSKVCKGRAFHSDGVVAVPRFLAASPLSSVA